MSATIPPMTIGIYHGYELTGSGSNEYTRYIARGLARLGHHVHVLCRDHRPASLDYVKAAYLWTLGGSGGLNATSDLLFLRDRDDLPKRETSAGGSVTVHVLPHAQIRPVFVCDKQRKGDVRMFIDLDEHAIIRLPYRIHHGGPCCPDGVSYAGRTCQPLSLPTNCMC